MNILFLIGNGFDVNIGIKSKYSEFYKYYQTVKSENQLIKDLKQSISDKDENWSDLEFALGDHCKNLNNIDELDIILEDIGSNLSKYLQQEEDNFNFENIDKEKLIGSLAFPERSLSQADRNQVLELKNKYNSVLWNVNLISFNYTNSIERIIGDSYENFQLGIHHGKTINLRKIHHVHGYKDKRMIIGVNDISQINNESFREDIDVLESIVKPESNRAVKDMVDDLCKAEIAKANLICVFGSSIGDTDKLWWELIAKRLFAVNTKLVIFRRSSKPVPDRIIQKSQREVRMKMKEFLSKTNLNEEEILQISDNIIISINSNIFDISL